MSYKRLKKLQLEQLQYELKVESCIVDHALTLSLIMPSVLSHVRSTY